MLSYFLIYGTKYHLIGDKEFKTYCPFCDLKNTFNYSVIAAYSHLYYIPTFPNPNGKYTIAKCLNCEKVFSKKEFTEEMKAKSEEVNEIIRIPLWFWTGLIIILTLFSTIFIVV